MIFEVGVNANNRQAFTLCDTVLQYFRPDQVTPAWAEQHCS